MPLPELPEKRGKGADDLDGRETGGTNNNFSSAPAREVNKTSIFEETATRASVKQNRGLCSVQDKEDKG